MKNLAVMQVLIQNPIMICTTLVHKTSNLLVKISNIWKRQILPKFVNYSTTENIRIFFFGGTHPAHKILMKTEHFL